MARKGKNSSQNRARTTALNKAYRARAAALKQAGVLSARVNARKNITRGTRTKINKFVDVLEGRTAAVKATPDIRRKYEGILETRSSFLIIPKDRAKERAKISRGLVEIERPLFGPGVEPLKFGQESEVILPFKLVDMQHLVERLKTDPTLDGLKRPGEMFAFRLDGWSSKIGFVDAEEMGDYIQVNYQHLFKPGQTQKVIKYLSFLRFKNYGSHRADYSEHSGKLKDKPYPKRFGRANAKGRSELKGHSTGYRSHEKDTERKKVYYANQTPEQRAQRLANNKTRAAAYRAAERANKK